MQIKVREELGMTPDYERLAKYIVDFYGLDITIEEAKALLVKQRKTL